MRTKSTQTIRDNVKILQDIALEMRPNYNMGRHQNFSLQRVVINNIIDIYSDGLYFDVTKYFDQNSTFGVTLRDKETNKLISRSYFDILRCDIDIEYVEDEDDEIIGLFIYITQDSTTLKISLRA